MGNAVSISGSLYSVTGTVHDIANDLGVQGLNVSLYEKDLIGKGDFLGIGVTDAAGVFRVGFDYSEFKWKLLDRMPDLYFIVDDGGTVLLNTKSSVIRNADANTPDIHLQVDLSGDKLRQLIHPVPVAGWVGGFAESNPAFAYPQPDLSSLEILDNLANIPKLQRQQKVVWPEFSWETHPGEADPKRCYQMFAPDISRLGYTNEGRVYAIICPQQGAASPILGAMNVEVTVTGNRGWANESDRSLAADMGVVGKIWFSPRVKHGTHLQHIKDDFERNHLPFPFDKAHAIQVATFLPGNPSEPYFPLKRDQSKDFPIPDFAKHEGLAWSVGHLAVEIGNIVPSGNAKVDDFNQLVLDLFNMASGNMLKSGNILSWNVWFTAPELVDQAEWAAHAEKWRLSIDADHGSPEGDGTTARYFDGTQFKPLQSLLDDELPKILAFIKKHL